MKHNKFILHFFIVMVFFISITAISAADLNDTGSFDILKDVGDKSYADLYSEIQTVGSNFNLNSDYKFNPETDTNYSEGINITKNKFVINGNNHIIDCSNHARAFYVPGKNVEIKNLIIQNAFYGYGSAIRADSKLTLNNVTFINCIGDNETYSAGAVYSNKGLNVNNCKFIDNCGENGASISSFGGTVNVLNSTFTSSSDNIIKGQIYLSNSKLIADNSNFLNTTSKYAAAIFSTYDGAIIVKNSKFRNLFAEKTAGAIGARVISNLTISDCEFDNVASENNGGALFVDVFAGDSVFGSWTTISNTLFNNCYSGFGGVILQLDGNLIINTTNFTSNSANYEGGAIYTSHTDVEIHNSRFISNTIGDDMSFGGACYFDEGSALLKGNNFENNDAYEGSAIYAYDVDALNLIGNYFNNPSDGISVYTVYGKVNRDQDNNYTSDVKSFNNTNDFYNFEGNAKPLIILDSNITYDGMPEFFDLRNYGWITPVKNQGFMGACWAFGNVAALESALLRYTNQTFYLSENNMQNTMLKYSKYGDDVVAEGGNAFTAVAYLIDWLGIFPAEYDSYDELGKISSLFITPEDIHIQNVVVIPPVKDAAGRDLIKNALLNYGAVAASHRADFNKNKYFNESSSAQYCYDSNDSTHRICIVGWDDNYSRYNFLKTPEGDGAWICKNSWGTDWGDEGYFYLSYYDTSFADKESVCYIINNDSYTRIYQNEVGGDGKWMPEAKYYANVFTAEEDEIIGAVGTFFNQSGREYEFTVSVNDVDVHTQKGVSKIAGYETVNLNKPVAVKKGDTFKITFKNMLYVTNNLRIHPQPGKSFVSDDGKEWEDLSKVLFIGVLKAYAVPKLDTTIASEDIYGYPGEKVNIIANVTDENGNSVLNGTAILIIGDKIGEAPNGFAAAGEYVAEVSNGKAVFEGVILPSPGVYPADLMYLGDDLYNPSNSTININVLKRDSEVTVDNITSKPNNLVNITANVTDSEGNPIQNGTATLTINGTNYTAPIVNGTVTFENIDLPAGNHVGVITYPGDDIYNPSSTAVNVDITKVNTNISADPVNGNASDKINLTVNIIDEDGNPVLNGTATLIIDGVEYNAEVHNGTATFIDVILPKSSTTAIVKYNGNEYYAPSESTFDIIINDAESEQNQTVPNESRKALNYSIDSKQTGNPILIALLVLMCLISNNILRCKR